MREGHLELAQWLLESGVEANVFTMAAVADVQALARRLGRKPEDALLRVSMQPASERVTALHVGCASDWKLRGRRRLTAQVRVAEVLAAAGAEIDAVARYRGIDEVNPLLCACWSSENLTLVRWLLDRGAHADESHLLAALGHLQRHVRPAYDIAEALVDWGVSVDGTGPVARTPLQAFAHQANHRTVAWLIAHGADIHFRAAGGRTAAHFAAERNTSPRTLSLLAESGADLSVRDDDGRTPLEIARLDGKGRLVEWLSRQARARGRR
jgi:ankyrin repeat protein